MLHLRKALCICITALLLAQPVLAETTLPTGQEADIVTALYEVENIPADFDSRTFPDWLRNLTTAPLFSLNSNGNWTPVLASALPEDVTENHAGTYGIPGKAQRGYAYRILLNENACFEDGTPITAENYVNSIRALFEDSKTAGNLLFLANASAIRSGKHHPGSDIISLNDAGFTGIGEAWSAGYTEFYLDTEGFWGLGGGWKSVSDRIRLRDYAMAGGLDEYFVSPAYLYRYYLMDGAISSYYQTEFIGICRTPGEAMTIDDLGIVKVDDHEIILLLQEPLTPSTLMQKLETLPLFWDHHDSFLSYGPYRIVSATKNELLLEPNPYWYGSADPRGYDRIFCQKIGS